VIVEHDDYVEVDLEEEKIQEGKKGEKENKKTEEIQSSKKKTVVDDSEDIPL
jgi:3-isopropylmalate dehydratase small subunit